MFDRMMSSSVRSVVSETATYLTPRARHSSATRTLSAPLLPTQTSAASSMALPKTSGMSASARVPGMTRTS